MEVKQIIKRVIIVAIILGGIIGVIEYTNNMNNVKNMQNNPILEKMK